MTQRRWTKALRKMQPSSSQTGLTIYADADLFDVSLAMMFAQVGGVFDIDTRIGDIRLPAAPRVKFHAEDDEHDITLLIPLEVSILGSHHMMKVILRGWVGIENGVAVVRNLDVDIDAPNNIVEDLVDTIADLLLKSVTKGESHISLPTVGNVFGRDVDARLVDMHVVEVRERPLLCITATLGPGDHEIQRAPLPERLALIPPPDDVGSLVIIVPQSIINTLMESVIGDFKHEIRLSIKAMGSKARLKGSICIEAPDIELQPGRMDVDLAVRFKKLKGGMSVMGATTWTKLRIKKFSIGMDLQLETGSDGRKASLHIEEVDKAKAKFRGGGSLSSVLFQQMVDQAIGIFNREIANRFEGKRIQLIDLPDTILSSSLPVKVRLGPHGLSVQQSAIIADLRLSAENPATGLSEFWNFQQIGWVRTHIRDRGEGQPVMFIPDLNMGLDIWASQLDHFSWRYRAIAYEWRGMGRTTRGRWPYRFGLLIRDLRGLMEELDIDQPVLCGQGFGAAIALAYAQRYPKDVKGVVFAGGASKLFNASVPVYLWRNTVKESKGPNVSDRFFARRAPKAAERLWSPDFRAEKPKVVLQWERRYRKNSIIATLNAMRAYRYHQLQLGRAAKLGVPMLAIRGRDDHPKNAAIAQRLGAKDVVLGTPSAMPMVETADEFNDELERFIIRVCQMDERTHGDESE